MSYFLWIDLFRCLSPERIHGNGVVATNKEMNFSSSKTAPDKCLVQPHRGFPATVEERPTANTDVRLSNSTEEQRVKIHCRDSQFRVVHTRFPAGGAHLIRLLLKDKTVFQGCC